MEQQEKLTVLLIEPECYPKVIEIDPGLEPLQKAVGGWIEAIYPWEDNAAIVLNEEGKINQLPLNRSLRTEDGVIKDLLRLAYKENKNRSAEIKVENIKAPILLLGGAMDSMCPNEETFNDITQRLKSSDFSYHVESIIYPHLSHYVLPIKPLSAKMFLAERKYPNECNKERVESWEDTLSFLKTYWK